MRSIRHRTRKSNEITARFVLPAAKKHGNDTINNTKIPVNSRIVIFYQPISGNAHFSIALI